MTRRLIQLFFFYLCHEICSKTESIEEYDPSAPRLAWFASFPMSGSKDIINMIQTTTIETTATNYGHMMHNEKGLLQGTYESVPVYKSRINGPYIFSHHLALPKTYLPVVTHCGGHCTKCLPHKYIMRRDSFFSSCTAGIKFTPSTDFLGLKGGKYEDVKYDAKMISRVLLMIRDPFDVVQDRYISYHYGFDSMGYRRVRRRFFSTPDKKAFQEYCLEEERSASKHEDEWFTDPDIRNAMKRVPCHAEIYRWVQWHNLFFQVIAYLRKLYHVIHYQDINNDKTRKDLFRFFELETYRTEETPVQLKDDQRYFSTEDKIKLRKLIQLTADKDTMTHIQRYVF